MVLTIKDRVYKKICMQHSNQQYNGKLNRQLDESYDKILKAIQILLTTSLLHRY
jgi:hypothetical protein